MRIMGIDLGTKRIGIAVSDETFTIARGYDIIERNYDINVTVNKIKDIISELNIKEIILGFPLHMNGAIGERAEDSIKFAELLEEQTGLNVKLWDERLSTKTALDVMTRASVHHKKRRQIIDKLAAQIILQEYLDSLSAEDP